MNNNTVLIIVKGEDKSFSIINWKYDKYKPFVYITFNNGKRYTYRIEDVVIKQNPRVVKIDNSVVIKDGVQLFAVDSLYYFDKKCRIVYKSGYKELCNSESIKVVFSALDEPKSKNCFEYLKSIAVRIGLVVDKTNILADRYNKIDFIRDDSVLAAFLKGGCHLKINKIKTPAIYPFGFNLSQKQAVLNALQYDISIIEGPPGTGKTQTILNIIANAVMRGESVAVVSSNNSATANVLEKLKKYKVDFIAAPLGNSDNKEQFIEHQSSEIPNYREYITEIKNLKKTEEHETAICKYLNLKNELSRLNLEKNAIEKELAHFSDYYNGLNVASDLISFRRINRPELFLDLASEYELISDQKKRFGFLRKLLFKFRYKLKNLNFFGTDVITVSAFCQNLFYSYKIKEIESGIKSIKSFLSSSDFDYKMETYTDSAMRIFKGTLAEKYKNKRVRKTYEISDLWKNSDEFINDYPVILSTTYSLRSSLSSRTVYDYVIIDEASQVDLATGALALSCARKAVVVGDLKQLSNVVPPDKKEMTDEIYYSFSLGELYKYSENSILSSVIKLFPEAPRILLREHYRCHPEIIGFCNQRFYNGDLIVLTKPDNEREPMLVYKTVAGNHARNHINQRQIDVILNEVIPQQNLNVNDNSVGIVTPYRKQADELQKAFFGTTVKADTADKFQGQEKSVMIFSTVDNEIGDFASDPNRLNVAVSRAIDQFIIVTDGNENDTASPIHDLIGYIRYNHHETINSEINSVFDYLYEQNSAARERLLLKIGRASEFDSENLMLGLIREILSSDEYSKYGAVMHVPLRMMLNDLSKLETRELSFASNHLTHVDFLIFSKLTHQPVLVIEVDGFAYHHNEKQIERDAVKDTVLQKYGIPILRLSTTGSGEKKKIEKELERIKKTG